MRRIIVTIALMLTFSQAAFTQEAASAVASPAQNLTAKVDQLFAQWDKPDTPGCALAIIKDGRIIYKRGYGMANLELNVPITPATVFQVGSIAKQFTAMAILLLAQQGRLSLDDDVRKYIPEVPDFGTTITLRHLIHHTSGLRDQYEMLEMAGWRSDDVIMEKDVLDMVARQRTLNNKPGEQYLYTNTGYTLLAVVVKRVTGKSLVEFAETNIFKPLGMTSTRFVDDHRVIIKGLADAYLPREGNVFLKWMPADDHVGADNLFTTVEDLALWDQNFYDKRVGGAVVIEQMLTPGVIKNDPTFDYAFGLNINQYKGLRMIQHSGSRLGYRAQLMRFPEQRFSVACLCNARIEPDTIARRIADIYLADQFKQAALSPSPLTVAPPDAVKLSEKELSSVAGLYLNPLNDTVRRVYVKDGKLMYFRAPGNESELAPLGNDRFLMLGVRNRVEITFKRTRAGAPLQMIFTEAGRTTVQESVKEASYKPEQLNEFAGLYYSPELDTTYSITPQDGKLQMRTGNWGNFLLSPRFVDSFENQAEMGSLIFTRDAKGRINGFLIRSGKVRNLRFNKTGRAAS